MTRFFVRGSKLTLFCVRVENGLFLVSMEVDLVIVMVETDLMSSWGIELYLNFVKG